MGWIRLIMSDTNSRNLLGFLILNLSFAFVELFYGVRNRRNHSASFVMKTLIVRSGPTPWVSSRTVSTCSSIAQVRSHHSQWERGEKRELFTFHYRTTGRAGGDGDHQVESQ